MSAGKPYRAHGEILPMEEAPPPAWVVRLENRATWFALASLPVSALLVWIVHQ
jgi:hypothetical protein